MPTVRTFLTMASTLALGLACFMAMGVAQAAEPVNIDNFVRAESDHYFKAKADDGFFGKIKHIREAPAIDHQLVVRMNRDTVYSYGIFDLTEPVTIIKPDTGGRFQSLVVLNQDHYIKLVAYDAGEYKLTRELMGTRYAHVAIRTLANPDDPADMKAAHAAQDAVKWIQDKPGKLELLDWDQEQLAKLRAAIKALAPFVGDSKRMFGDEDEVTEVRHLIGAAAGWGGNREQDALYLNFTPQGNDGTTPFVLKVPADVPVDGFWSISLYNKDGYFQKNPQGAYSLNNLTAKKEADGGVTVHFAGDPSQPNYLAIMPGWNYMVRLYRPREEILNGQWVFPDPKRVK